MTKLMVNFRNFPKVPNKLNPAAVIITIIIIIPPKNVKYSLLLSDFNDA